MNAAARPRIASALALALVAACGGASPATPKAPETSGADPSASAARAEAPAGPSDDRGEGAGEASRAAAEPTPTRPRGPAPTKIAARHVLVQYMGAERAPASVVRTKDQARAVAEKVLARARAGEDVGQLAAELSDEPGAGPRGGALGRFGKGMMAPAFEQAAFGLDVGEVSDVVESPFGFHVIERTE